MAKAAIVKKFCVARHCGRGKVAI
jgi:hypothetical protein